VRRRAAPCGAGCAPDRAKIADSVTFLGKRADKASLQPSGVADSIERDRGRTEFELVKVARDPANPSRRTLRLELARK